MPLAFYFDHNVPGPIASGLRGRGIDVLTAYEDRAHELADPEDAAEYARLVQREENREVASMQLTWAEKMERKGIVKGRAEMKAETLEALRGIVLHLLEQRFGPLPERVRRRVERLRTLRSLRRIAEQVLVAKSIRDLGLS